MRRVQYASALRLFFVLSLAAASCKEELPPYTDTRDVFDGRLAAAYAISRAENSLKAYLTVINKYDETLEDTSILSGQIVLTWQVDPTFRRTLQLSDANILFARNYNPDTKMLRLDAGDSILFGVSWNFLSDDGRDLKRLVPFRHDPTCLARWISAAPVPIIIEASLTVFKRTGRVVPPVFIYQFELVREYVDPHNC